MIETIHNPCANLDLLGIDQNIFTTARKKGHM